MNNKSILTVAVAALGLAQVAMAQTNIQFFYDFGKDRKHLTTTVEGFYNDKWGNTFFFVDHDFNAKNENDKVIAPSGTYAEIARCFNFWQDTPLAAFSFQAEYNGGVYQGFTVNNAYLFGVDYFMHSSDFSKTLNLKVLHKMITGSQQKLPLQLTAVWGIQDLCGVKGLRFSGFADFWWEDHIVFDDDNSIDIAKTVFISEPQLWYNVGQHFGCDNLHVGTEIELSYNFGTGKGFWCRPCFGAKWVF